MEQVVALTRQLGMPLVETPMEGVFLVQRTATGSGGDNTFSSAGRIRSRANRIDPRDPAIAGLTVKTWLDRQSDPPDAKAAYEAMVEGLWCRPAGEVPLWYLIDNDRRVTSNGNELQYSVGHTMFAAAEALAATFGARVRLNTSVARVERSTEFAQVVTADGETLAARRVIVAVPPVMAARIDYEPALPEALAGALGAWTSGAVIKVLIRYDRPFWRDRGLSGMVAWRDVPGLFACDISSEHACALVIFAGGSAAADWSNKGPDFIRSEIVSRLQEAFGAEAGQFSDFRIRDWVDDRWSGGGYSDVITDMDAYDAETVLRDGAPPVFFAASELASAFPSYVEGAIVAGREAADRVIASLESAGSGRGP